MEDDRYTRITLRIPKDLHAKLESASESKSRSLNAEIINRLEQGADVETLNRLVLRLERDLAHAELEAETNRHTAGFVSEALVAVVDAMPPMDRLPGNPHDMTAQEWKAFASEMVRRSHGIVARLRALIEKATLAERKLSGGQQKTAFETFEAQEKRRATTFDLGDTEDFMPKGGPSATVRPIKRSGSKKAKP